MTIGRLALAVAGALALCPAAAPAATFTPACSGTTGDAGSLKAAITAANTNAGPDTVRLGAGCRYVLGAPDNNWYKGPLPVIVSNGNRFRVTGRLSGQTAKRIVIRAERQPVALKAKAISVPSGSKGTIKLSLPTPLARVLARTGKLALRLRARVSDPAGHTRTVTKTLTPRIKRKRTGRH